MQTIVELAEVIATIRQQAVQALAEKDREIEALKEQIGRMEARLQGLDVERGD